MPHRDMIVIGASAGGVEALIELVKHLPEDFPATLFIAIHFPSYSVSYLPQILSRSGKLPALAAEDGAVPLPGHIYVAPPDYHLLVHPQCIRLSRGPKENGHRPAIDTLFRSAARNCGPRAIGIILSGALDDGTVGLSMIKARGGLVVVQDPAEAAFDSMVRSAIAHVHVDAVLPIQAIADWLTTQVNVRVDKDTSMANNEIENEDRQVFLDKEAREKGHYPNAPAPLTCPDCGGILWEFRDGELVRFRCHVGHAYSLDSLITEQADDVERALWSSIRALEEKAALARRMATHARQGNRTMSEAQFLARADESKRHADLIRQVVMQQSILKSSEQPASGYDSPGADANGMTE